MENLNQVVQNEKPSAMKMALAGVYLIFFIPIMLVLFGFLALLISIFVSII